MSESAIPARSAARNLGENLNISTSRGMTIEGLLAVALGAVAGSISLVGFGLDSFIELMSGSALLWRMSVDADLERREFNGRQALRIVGICFLLLVVYIADESGADLLLRRAPEHSPPGIILACVLLAVMPILSRAKRRLGVI